MITDTMRAFVDGTPSDDGPIRFVAGTEGLKIDGRDYRMDGMDLGRYESNPVVMWCHDLTKPPIGRGVPAVDAGRLLLDVEFDLADPFAADIDGKYRRGFLNAVSMTALPTDGNGGLGPRRGVVEHSELIEVSAVPVPLDPDALKVTGQRAMRHLGLELLDLAEHRRTLSVNDQRERLDTALNDRFGGENTWIWVRDFDPAEGWVVYAVESDNDGYATYRLGYSIDADDNLTLDTGTPEEVEVTTSYEPVTGSSSQDQVPDTTDDTAMRSLIERLEEMGFQRSTPPPPANDLDALAAIAAALPTPKEG